MPNITFTFELPTEVCELLTASPDMQLEVRVKPKQPEPKDDGYSFAPQPGNNFTEKWVDGPEDYSDVQQGTARYQGRNYAIKLGFTIRHVAGRKRVRITIWVNDYPQAEFAGADDVVGSSPVAALIKINGKQLSSDAELPAAYREFTVGQYRDVVNGPHARNGLAVICAHDDYQTMVKHAILRYIEKWG